jgi:molybdopterin-containing oxidoreductase family membrane subunit
MALLRYESQVRPALIEGDKDYHQVTEDICRPVEARPTKLWWIGFLFSVLVLCFGILSVTDGGDIWNGTMEFA